MSIIKLDNNAPPGYFLQAAKIHIAEIHFGFLPLMGERFLTRLYREMANLPTAGLWVEEKERAITGFLLGSVDFQKSYQQVMVKAGFALSWLGISAIFKKDVVQKLPAILKYPFLSTRGEIKRNEPSPSKAELLSIAVLGSMHSQGIGKSLVNAFEENLKTRGVSSYFVTTNSNDIGSNTFYKKMGFIPYGLREHNDLILQVYLKEFC